MERFEISRRNLLKGVAAVGAASMLPSLSTSMVRRPKRSIRFAHFADIHVQPEKRAGIGMMRALRHCQDLKDKPEMIFTGGDLVMDAFAATFDRTQAQWEIFTKVLNDSTSLPVEHTIGNHDVWGWSKGASKTTGDEMLYGKKWALQVLGLNSPYRSFDRAGWHWIVLDSVFPRGSGYTGKLDDEQFEWLTADLAANKSKHTLISSHIPILSASVFFDGDLAKSGDWAVPGAWMHVDAAKLKDLFSKHPQVKLCISGHIHLVDRVDYNGVTYLCNGAVCGSWWDGRYYETGPGYAMINLYDDGTFEREYIEWGWTPPS